MSTNGGTQDDDEADTNRPHQVDWRHIFEAFMSAAGPRIEAISNAQIQLGDDFKTELRAIGQVLWNVSENLATLTAKVERLETSIVDRVARVEGAQVAAAESADRTHRELWRELGANRRIVNQVSGPMVPDLREPDEITRVRDLPPIASVVKAELLQAKYDSAHDKLKKIEERREWLSRQTLLWIVGAMAFVMTTIATVLVTLLAKRFL